MESLRPPRSEIFFRRYSKDENGEWKSLLTQEYIALDLSTCYVFSLFGISFASFTRKYCNPFEKVIIVSALSNILSMIYVLIKKSIKWITRLIFIDNNNKNHVWNLTHVSRLIQATRREWQFRLYKGVRKKQIHDHWNIPKIYLHKNMNIIPIIFQLLLAFFFLSFSFGVNISKKQSASR